MLFRSLPDSGLDKFKIEYKKENYVIKQLKTNRELIMEGQTLKHCVGGYTNNCILRGSFIFSLRIYFHDTELDSVVETPLITTEVNKNRILQMKGTRNRACNEVERFIINEWRREFKISAY